MRQLRFCFSFALGIVALALLASIAAADSTAAKHTVSTESGGAVQMMSRVTSVDPVEAGSAQAAYKCSIWPYGTRRGERMRFRANFICNGNGVVRMVLTGEARLVIKGGSDKPISPRYTIRRSGAGRLAYIDNPRCARKGRQVILKAFGKILTVNKETKSIRKERRLRLC